MNKAELRRRYLANQRAMSGEERDSTSELITDHFFSGFDLSLVHFLHCFIPIEKFKEINTRNIFARIWRDFPQIQTVVPRVVFGTNEMQSLTFGHDTELTKNLWDIHEPRDGDRVESDLIDMVLVPGLCFDREGHRVGYGKGFYDRFLRTCRPNCIKIGLSYFDPIEKIDDVHDGDVLLNFLVTPHGMRNAESGVRNSDQRELM